MNGKWMIIHIGDDIYPVYQTPRKDGTKENYLLDTPRFMGIENPDLLSKFNGMTVPLKVQEWGMCRATMVPFFDEYKIKITPAS